MSRFSSFKAGFRAVVLTDRDAHAGNPCVTDDPAASTRLTAKGQGSRRGNAIRAAVLVFSVAALPGLVCSQPVVRFTNETTTRGISATRPWSLAIGDYDNDGDLDLFFSEQDTAAHLFANDGNAFFTDEAATAGLDLIGLWVVSKSLFWDFDSDGHLDLYIVQRGNNKHMVNQGDKTYLDNAAAAGLLGQWDTNSAVAFDYDQDGHLDLYLGQGAWDGGEVHRLMRNRGDGTFEDVTAAAGLGGTFWGGGALVADYDLDGDPDIYVIHNGQNRFYSNNGDGSFTELSGIGADDGGLGNGGCAGDIDNDGDFDIYVVNDNGLCRMLRNNFHPSGNLTFSDVTILAGLGGVTDNGMDGSFGDVDNDGDLDLYVVLNLFGLAGQDHLFLNDGSGAFTDVTVSANLVDTGYSDSGGCGLADLNGDGKLDLIISDNQYAFTVNASTGTGHWLSIGLRGTTSNREGAGARVTVAPTTGTVPVQMRERRVGKPRGTQDSPWLHFGLDDCSSEVLVTVNWPSGLVQTLPVSPVDRHVLIVEGSGDLGLAPLEGFEFEGPEGGPFGPASTTYTLANLGVSSMDWTSTATETWLDVTPTSGTLAPGSSTTVSVSVNANADVLARGIYSSVLSFQDNTNTTSLGVPIDLVVGLKRILVYTQYGDASQEIPRTFAAIETVGTNYIRTDLTDYTQLASAIVGKNVLLIPEMENAGAGQLQTVGAAWAATLSSFVNSGGVVVQCDFEGRYHILDSAGLMSITGSSTVNDMSLVVADPDDPIAEGVRNYTAINGSTGYSNADGNVVIETAGGMPVVIHKRIGSGSVVALGHDYFETNADQSRVVGNAVFNLPGGPPDDLVVTPSGYLDARGPRGGPFVPAETTYTLTNTGSSSLDWSTTWTANWLDASPTSGTLAPGTSTTVVVRITAAANALPAGNQSALVTFTNTTSGKTRQRQVWLEIGLKRILVYTQYADHSEEIPRTFAAIETVSTTYIRTDLADYRLLDGALPGQDVLLIPEQERASAGQLQTVGITWASTLASFVTGGGVVVQCDFEGRYHILDSAGLMSITGSTTLNDVPLLVVDPDDPVAQDVWNYTAVDGSSGYNNADGNIVIQSAGGIPVVIHKRVGQGSVVAIGHDYYATNPDQSRVVGNAVFNLPAPDDDLAVTPLGRFEARGPAGGPFVPSRTTYTLTNTGSASLDWASTWTGTWLEATPTTGTLAPGSTTTLVVRLTAAANALPAGTRNATVTISNTTSGKARRRQVWLEIGLKRILVYTQYADPSEEVPRTFTAIETVGTNYIRADLTDYRFLDSALPGQDVLLIPEMESANAGQLQTVGTAWASTLASFVSSGGVVVQCDFEARYHILDRAGLMSITGSTTVNGAALTIADPTDAVAAGVSNYTAENGSSSYNSTDGNVVVETVGGAPVVIHKTIGLGSVVAIGHDYYMTNSNQSRIVGNAVFNLPVTHDDMFVWPETGLASSGNQGGPFLPGCTTYTVKNVGLAPLDWETSWTQPWLDVTPSSGTLASGSSVIVSVCINANANGLPGNSTTTDTVAFANVNSSYTETRDVTLTVISPPPVIRVEIPTPLEATLPRDGATSFGPGFTIHNDGVATLGYQISIRYESGPTGLLDVAVCGTVNMTDVQAKLIGTGQFNSVGIINVGTRTPTLAELQAYDAVIVYRDLDYADATALGNVMADYVDSGGGVVCMMFEIAHGWVTGSAPGTMGGRWDFSSYWLIPRQAQLQLSMNATLGAVHDPTHPIMRGVRTFDGGFRSFRPQELAVPASRNRIADWSDGRPLVVTGTVGTVPRADLGFFPVSADASLQGWLPSTDGALLMANALSWVADAAYPGWLTVDESTSASVPGSSSVEKWVQFDATDLDAGVYRATITIGHNDPTAAAFDIPCTLTVVGTRIIGITPSSAQPPSEMIAFDGWTIIAGGSITAYEWRSSLDGRLNTNEDFTSSSNELTVGDHLITFTVWDDGGTSWSDTANLTILNAAPTVAPIALWPNPAQAGRPVEIRVDGWDNDERGQAIPEGELTWTDGAHSGVLPGRHEYLAPTTAGDYTIQYRAQDDEGVWSTSVSTVLHVVEQTDTRRWIRYP